MKKDCKICKYFWNILIALDQFINTVFGGDPDETISSRAGKEQTTKLWAKYLCWLLNKLQTNHCKDSIELDEGNDAIL